MMNGVTSHSMRQKGIDYKVNFGVELPRLQTYAAEYEPSYSLALALWNEPIRECRLMAGMLMPPHEMDIPTAEMWVEQMHYQEEAECSVMHLFQHMPQAADMAFAWIARDEDIFRLCGWLLMGRLFMNGSEPTQRDADELLDQAACALNDTPVRAAVYNTLLKYMDLSKTAQIRGEEVLRMHNL